MLLYIPFLIPSSESVNYYARQRCRVNIPVITSSLTWCCRTNWCHPFWCDCRGKTCPTCHTWLHCWPTMSVYLGVTCATIYTRPTQCHVSPILQTVPPYRRKCYFAPMLANENRFWTTKANHGLVGPQCAEWCHTVNTSLKVYCKVVHSTTGPHKPQPTGSTIQASAHRPPLVAVADLWQYVQYVLNFI